MDIIRSIIPASPFFISDENLISSNVAEDEYPAFNPTTHYEAGDRVQSVSPTGTVTFTIASPCVMTWTNSQLADNTPVRFTTTGALPTGIITGRLYYVRRKTGSTYNIATSRNGTPIATSGSQSGTHTGNATRHDVYEALRSGFSSGTTGSSISGTTWTVTAISSGQVTIGMTLSEVAGGSGVAANTTVVAFLTGNGGVGTYKISPSQTVSNKGIQGTAPITDVVSPSNPGGFWARADSTNRWRMHDNMVSSQTSNPDTINNVYKLTAICDAAVLLDLDCESVNVTITDAVDGEVYNRTIQASTISGIDDYYKYAYEPIVRKRDILFADLPKFPQAELELTITAAPGKNAMCGTFMFGQMLKVGATQYGMQLGIQDYSLKQSDDFGNQVVIERNYSRRVSLVSYIENSSVDMIHDQLAAYRAVPAVYIGASQFGSSFVFGFYKEFNVEIAYPDVSLCTMDIEGLT